MKKHAKKLAAFLFVALLAAVCIFADVPLFGGVQQVAFAETVSGTCGENITWSIDTETDTLTVSGSGAMTDFSYNGAPWYSIRGEFNKVVIGDDVTSIGKYAFYGCEKLADIDFGGVKTVNGYAFQKCTALTDITLGRSVETIGDYAFYSSGVANVNFNSELKTIGQAAFWKAPITEAMLPDGVTFIGEDAFRECESLVAVRIPSSVTRIEETAFYRCSALNSVYIDDLKSFCEITYGDIEYQNGYGSYESSSPLRYAKNLYVGGEFVTELVIPEGTTKIDPFVFYNFEGMTSVSIPSSVKKIGRSAFGRSESLKTVKINGDGVIIDETAFLESHVKNVEITGSVESIGRMAFYYCNSLETLKLTGKIGSIDVDAFNFMYGTAYELHLTDFASWFDASFANEYSVPFYNAKSFTVDGNAVTEFVIPDGKTAIPAYALYYSDFDSIVVPKSVQSIGESSLGSGIIKYKGSEEDWSSIPDNPYLNSDKVIYNYVADGTCGENLTWVLDSNGKITISGTGAMDDYSSSVKPPWNDYRTSITSVVIEKGVTTIGNYAFRIANALTSASIPDTVETIGFYSFDQCSALESITVPASVKTINGYAFSNSGLKNITLYEGLETLGVGAFENCKIESISLPESVTSVGSWAFYNCTSLKSINIPKNITALSEYMLNSCTALESISASSASSSFSSKDGVLFDKSGETVIKCPEGKSGSYTVPSGVKAIADSAFSSCTKLTEIILPNTVSSIGTEAFYYCTSIKEITIPSGVAVIPAEAIRACKALEKVTIPSSVTSIESYAFYNNDNLCLVLYTGSESDWNNKISIATKNDPLTAAIKAYNFNPNNANAVVASGTCGVYLTWTLDSSGKLTISGQGIMSNYNLENLPWYKLRNLITSVEMNAGTTIGNNAFNGCVNLKSVKLCNGITTVGQSAFSGCTSLESIALPATVTAISGNAFQNCTSLKEIAIPSGVKHINAFMFDGCTSLEKVSIPQSVTTMDTNVFRNCTSLEGISLPSGMTSIGSYSFQGCTALKKIEIPSGVTYINPYIFDSCTSLKSISIPEGVTTIDKAAFVDCTALESVSFPSTLKTVGGSAFRYCTALKNIVLPEGLTKISGYAFEGCSSLEEVTIPRTVTSIGDSAFNECTSLSTLYYSGNSAEWAEISIYDGNTPLTSAYLIVAEYLVSFAPVSGSDVPETQIKKSGEPLIISDVVPEKEDHIFVGWYFPGWGEDMVFVPGGEFDIDCNVTLEALWTQLGITAQPQDTSAHLGSTASVTVEAEGVELTYEWYYKDAGDEEFTLSSVTDPTYTAEMTEETAGRKVYCVATDKYGNKIESETAVLYAVGITEQPTSTFGGIGKNLSAKVIAIGEELTYAWYVFDENANTYYKSPVTTDTYSLEMSEQTAGRIVYCVVTDKFGTQAASDTVIFSLFAITETPQNTFAAPNAVASVSVTALGDDLTYEWHVRRAGGSEYIATGKSLENKYFITMNADNSGTSVYCRITDGYGNVLTTRPVTLAMLGITTQPKDAFALIGKNASATVAAAGDDLTYAWFVKDPDKSSFTKSSIASNTYSFKMTEAKSGRKIYCVVTDKYGNSVTTETVTLSAAIPPVITAQPQNASAALGKVVSTSVSAEGEGLTYAWYICEPGKTTFGKSSITSSTYSYKMTEAKDGRKAYCVITNIYGASVTTEMATLSAAIPPVITAQPQNASAALGKVVSTSVSAEGEGLTYTWYVCEPNKTSFYKSSITSSTYSYKMTEAKDGRKAYCVVTNSYGASVTSETVTLTMAEPSVIITKQPQNASAILGKNVSTSVTAEGEDLTYTWYICEPGKTKFGKSSITSSTYSYKMTEAKDGRKVYCVITDANGFSVTSNTVTLTMEEPTIIITKQPQNASAALGKNVSTSVTAEGEGLTYTWYICEPGKTKFGKSSITASIYSYKMTEAKDGRKVYCIIADAEGNTVKTNTVTLTMVSKTPLAITTQPANAFATSGGVASTKIAAQGDGLTYTWYVLDPGKSDYVKSSITKSTYSCTMTAAKDGRRVYCVITDAYGDSVKSSIAFLAIE